MTEEKNSGDTAHKGRLQLFVPFNEMKVAF